MFTHSQSLLSIFATRKQNTGTWKLYSQLSERTDEVETSKATEGQLQGHVIALSFAVPPLPGALWPHSPYFWSNLVCVLDCMVHHLRRQPCFHWQLSQGQCSWELIQWSKFCLEKLTVSELDNRFTTFLRNLKVHYCGHKTHQNFLIVCLSIVMMAWGYVSVELRPLMGPLSNPRDMSECGRMVKLYWQEKTKWLRKSVPDSLWPPQVPNGPSWAQT
jgi:hypothetical protein